MDTGYWLSRRLPSHYFDKYLLEIVEMFARLLAKKKKNPDQPEDAAEKRLKKIMDVVGKVDNQINTFTKQYLIFWIILV